MSIYGMGNFAAAMPVDPVKIDLAEAELTVLQTLHQSIVEGCRTKCLVPYYTEVELAKGEAACVDRCTSKFFKVNTVIGEYMRKARIGPEQVTAPSLIMPSLGQHSTLGDTGKSQ